jgi:GTP:adenosylcobinamide-phosphate guanylyltransferase
MSKITVDNVDYDIANLQEEERAIVIAINKCDEELERLNHMYAILSTARQAYVNDLGSRLNKEDFK